MLALSSIATVGIVTLLKVIGVLAIGSLIVAASFTERQVVGAAATAFFFVMLLIQAPFLPLYFSKSERDELDKVKRERNQENG